MIQFLKDMFHYMVTDEDNRVLANTSPLVFMHLACIGVFFTGVPGWPAIVALILTYSLRVFTLTGFYHRYFSHRAFKTSRPFQFVMAFIGASAAQQGAMWWAANHRHHHQHSDQEEDIHSPRQEGLFWAHIGWVLCRAFNDIQKDRIRDLMKFPELVWLEKYHVIAPATLALSMLGLGHLCYLYFPEWGTNGPQMLMWGFFVSTMLVYHVTFMVNSVTHVVGKKRFKTTDDSKNSLGVALLTFGEGWHNNHHRYPLSAAQGMYWWEIDITYYGLLALEKLGLIWDLKAYPKKLYEEAEQAEKAAEKTAA